MERMENVVAGLSVLLTSVGSSSAQSTTTWSTSYEEIITTTIFLPSAFFSPAPVQQGFIARLSSSSSSTTFYNLVPGFSNNLTDLALALVTQYGEFGCPFSASAAGTRFLWQK